MPRSAIALLLWSATFLLALSSPAAEDTRTLPELALRADAVVVGRVGALSPNPKEAGGSVAIWVERDLKGDLEGERDIVWLTRNELPKAEIGPGLWLLLLAQSGGGAWSVTPKDRGAVSVPSLDAPAVKEVAAAVAGFDSPVDGETPEKEEIDLWVKKSGRGSAKARREAFAKLVAAGNVARPQLVNATESRDPEIATTARRLLQLNSGGPVVNGVRLGLEPGRMVLKGNDRRILTAHFVNTTDAELRIVLGQSAWGENVQAAAAYEVRKMEGGVPSKDTLPTVLPQNYGTAPQGAQALPVVRQIPLFASLPVAVELSADITTLDGKDNVRLKFPHGFVDLPGRGTYALRARFDCPGPRPDQQALQSSGFWGGGQLVSNEIYIEVK